MPQNDFTAQVGTWVQQTQERIIAVRNESAQRVVEAASEIIPQGGNLPFSTGFLRASAVATLDEPNFQTKDAPTDGAKVAYDPSVVTLTIAGADLKATISVVWTAAYAMRMEYGFTGEDSLGRKYNQKGFRFVGLAVQTWPQIVDAVAKEAQNRAGG